MYLQIMIHVIYTYRNTYTHTHTYTSITKIVKISTLKHISLEKVEEQLFGFTDK